LWPLSRTAMPKQFLKLFEGRSLYQLTLERNQRICAERKVITNIEHYFLAKDQAEESGISVTDYLLEPSGRNTAPAIALGCMAMPEDHIVLVTPSDHLIRGQEAYEEAVARAVELAQEGRLVTFGISPSRPETGYGYIEAQAERVLKFHEKPDLATAKAYLNAGNYLWNSGIFCFRAGTYLEALARYAPEIYETSRYAYQQAIVEEGLIRIPQEAMAQIPAESIDYAVMEQASNVAVVPGEFSWSDLGSFEALAEELSTDEAGNLVFSEKHVELLDVEDLIVADTDDALLIARKGSGQKVKEAVARLKAEGSSLPEVHTLGHRPWGQFKVLDEGEGYKIKRIEVKPGARLSLQKHYHRNEHWVVLSGSATVTVGDRTYIVNPNESTYIRAGEVHRLENRGKLPLVIIEVQVGEYTGEDDIVRLEDDYQRMYT